MAVIEFGRGGKNYVNQLAISVPAGGICYQNRNGVGSISLNYVNYLAISDVLKDVYYQSGLGSGERWTVMLTKW